MDNVLGVGEGNEIQQAAHFVCSILLAEVALHIPANTKLSRKRDNVLGKHSMPSKSYTVFD